MSWRVIVRPFARAEMNQAHLWYAERSSQIATKFTVVLEAALAAIGRDPLHYQIIHNHIRRYNMLPFPYGLYYAVEAEDVVVLSCFHGRRDPAIWRKRR
jgi:plasmid stabilization system protein ParE